MQINLNENEIKQAIQDYLSARLVKTIASTDINMTAGRAPTGFTAAVDITYVEADWMAEPEVGQTVSPVAEVLPEVKKTVAKVVKPKAEAKVDPKPEVTSEPKSQEILKKVAKDLGVEDNIGTKVEAEEDPFNPDPAPEVAVETKTTEEVSFVEGENTMTENFELPTSADNVAAPITDDVEDLFNC